MYFCYLANSPAPVSGEPPGSTSSATIIQHVHHHHYNVHQEFVDKRRQEFQFVDKRKQAIKIADAPNANINLSGAFQSGVGLPGTTGEFLPGLYHIYNMYFGM